MVHGEEEQSYIFYVAPQEGWTRILGGRLRSIENQEAGIEFRGKMEPKFGSERCSMRE
jgi:hypothetical protein